MRVTVGMSLVLALWATAATAQQPAPDREPAPTESEPSPEAPPTPAEEAPPAPAEEAAPMPAEEAAPAGPVVVPPRPLSEPQAVYPPDKLEEGVESAVTMHIAILVDGSVGEVVVLESGGYDFDKAAVDAVALMRFEPATVDGVPTPVRISYTYRFTIEVKEVPVAPEPEPEPEPEPAILVIAGKVVERGTRKPMPGVPIIVRETGETFISDDKGTFEITGPGPGTYHLEVPLDRYEPLETVIVVREGQVAKVKLKLTRDSYADFKTVVKRERIDKEVARKQISAAEIQKIPGVSGDALKVVQILPGVARGFAGTGQPIIRGSSPTDTKVYLEGQLLPQLFHFGGLFSVINSDLIETVDYWPGGFSTRYGQAVGGLIDVKLRDIQLDRWHFIVESNIYHVSAFAEGPITEDTGLALAFRRSYIDLILNAVIPDDVLELTVAPVYYDYQAYFTHDFSPTHQLRLIVFGSDDELALVIDEPSGRGGIIEGGINSKISFHLMNAIWNAEVTDDVSVEASLRVGYQSGTVSVGSAFDIQIELFPVDLRAEVDWEIAENWEITMGVSGGAWPFELSFYGPPPPKEGNPPVQPDATQFTTQAQKSTVLYFAPYLEGTIRLWDRLTLVPGLRVDLFNLERSSYVSADPRIAVRVDLAEGSTVKLFAGLYHQPPTFDEWDSAIGNPDLGPERAFQVSVGFEQQITDFLSADVQVFYKWMDELVVTSNAIETGVPYTNDGIGRVYGLEVLIRHDPSDWFFGWLSYTLMKAERRDSPTQPWRSFDFDQTHILSLVGVFQLPYGFEAGFRFRYTTGNPTTPVIGATFDSDSDAFVPVFGQVNTARISDFHQLDLRIDKKFVFDVLMVGVYLEWQNVYARPNAEAVIYNYDYTESQPISGILFLPNLGLRVEF